MSRILTGSNVNTIKQTRVSEGQEQHVKAVDRFNKKMSQKINKESIIPVGNNIIIKCKLYQSTIHVPGNKEQGSVEWIEIFKISKRVEANSPEIKPGLKCSVNIPLLLATGGSPCYEEDLDHGQFVYFKISAEMVDYLYEFN